MAMTVMRIAASTLFRRPAVPRICFAVPQAVPKRFKASSPVADAASAIEQRYAEPLQWLHWGMGGGIIAALGLTWLAKDAKPEVKSQLFRLHEQIGLAVLVLFVPRLALRFATKVPPHMPGPLWETLASKATHLAMYGLMYSVPATGAAMMYLGGTPLPVIGSLEIPGRKSPTEADQANAKWAAGWHFWIGEAFGILIPLHIGAVGYHMVLNRDPIGRMAPPIVRTGIKFVEAAFVTRPGSLLVAAGFGGVSAVWLGLSAKDYMMTPSLILPPSASTDSGSRKIALDEMEKHNKEDDLWIAIEGYVYDVTNYFKNHPAPAGPSVIQKNAGADASKGFRDAKHSPKAQELRDKYRIGELERNLKSELAKVLNCDDMQERAKQLLTSGALAYYDAGAEDLTSCKEALDVWDRDWRLRPRNFIDVSSVDLSTTVLGHKLDVPIMAAPTALLKMGHEDGEAAVARGCQMMGVGNCLSTTASLSLEDVAAASPNCYRWFQLYVYKDHEMTKRLVQRADKEGYSAIVLTVDLPVLGNRTSLKRIGFSVPKEFKMANVAKELETSKDLAPAATAGEPEKKEEAGGVSLKDPGDRAAYVNKLYDQSLTLELLSWMATITDKPVVVKGILRGDSAALCAVYPNVRGIVVSNHGGRQLDNCLAPLSALPDVVNRVNEVNVERAKKGWPPVEVYVDGGITRGRDIFKALALGAKAVLVGRPMIYGMAVGGELGVARTVELLRDELKTVMQLSGAQTVDQIDRTFIVRQGKEKDEALTLQAGTDEAKSWNGLQFE